MFRYFTVCIEFQWEPIFCQLRNKHNRPSKYYNMRMIRGTLTYRTTPTKRNVLCTEFIVNFYVRSVLKMEQIVDKWHDVIKHRWMCGIVSCVFLKKRGRLTIKFLCVYKLHLENEQRNNKKREKNDLQEERDYNFKILFVDWCSV